MSDNWVVGNLQNALDTWNAKVTELWSLILTDPNLCHRCCKNLWQFCRGKKARTRGKAICSICFGESADNKRNGTDDNLVWNRPERYRSNYDFIRSCIGN